MKILVFFGNRLREIPLDGVSRFSVGSGKDDDLCIPESDLMPGHVVVSLADGRWKLVCKKPVSLVRNRQRQTVTAQALVPGEVFVLSTVCKISLVAAEDPAGPCAEAELPCDGALTVGANADNDIAIVSPLISKRHATIERRDGQFFIRDDGSTNGTFVDSYRIDSCVLKEGTRAFLGDTALELHGSAIRICCDAARVRLSAAAAPKGRESPAPEQKAGAPGRIAFRRSPRLLSEVPTGEIEIEAPPTLSGKPEINWLSTLLPTLVTVAIAVVMVFVLGNFMMMLYTLPMTLAGIIVSIVNYSKQNKKFRGQETTRIRKYNEHLEQAVKQISARQAEQLEALRQSDPEAGDCLRIAEMAERRLWERRPSDPDFMRVRVGSGTIDSSTKIKIPKQTLSLEEDALKQKPQEIYDKYCRVQSAPIVCDIFREQVCGIVGSRKDTLALLKNIIACLTVSHCYTEVRTVFIYDEADEAQLEWVRDLPHARSSDGKTGFVCTSKNAAQALLRPFFELLRRRKLELEANGSYGAAPEFLPYYLFVVAQPAYLDKRDPINEYLLRRTGLYAGIILAAENIIQLPKECGLIIDVKGRTGELYNRENAGAKQKFSIDSTDAGDFGAFGRAMGSIRCDEPALNETIPAKYSFLQMLGVRSADELDIGGNWKRSDVVRSLAAPIGIGENGKAIFLDLHESAHGPHGLLAGTTGSGKSEVLQSYVLSMAVRYPPCDVGFVIIDFKGGGMANHFRALPHLIGAITNIEGSEINRSLSSIKAELVKRQKLFAENGVDNIDKYIARFKSGLTPVPLPHLIIIVDEFAELKAEQPEFMKELISAARIGRSLGVHLILSTQKPAGQVSEQIWSNSKFQICLKVASPQDSTEVIRSPLAAGITLPGRAYLRVGNNEIFELFQSGYSGEKLPGTDETVLEAVVERIAGHCRDAGIEKLPSICLPPLEPLIFYPRPQPAGRFPLGVYDDPDNQCRGEYPADISESNTFIVGSSQSGKTNLLQCFIRGIAERFSPDEVSIYIIDFASGVLKSFEPLRHVGGVVTALEDEKFKNLIKLLNAEIDTRRRRFMALGVSSYAAYREAGKTDLPRIVLIVDNLSAVRELYGQDDDPLLPLCQTGLTYGLCLVIANNQAAGIGYKYFSSFSSRIALFCNDTGEYSAVFDRCVMRVPDIRGRCIVDVGKRLCACQIYLAFPGEREIDRAENIRAFIADIERTKAGRARPIPVVPDTLTAGSLTAAYGKLMDRKGRLVIGLDYENVAPVLLDLASQGTLAISGSQDGASRRLLMNVISLCAQIYPGETEFFAADSVGRSLAGSAGRENVAAYEYIPEKCAAMVKTVEARLLERYRAMMDGDDSVLSRAKLTVLILNGSDVIEAVSADPGAMAAFRNITGKYRNYNVCVLLGECPNQVITFNSPEALKKIKEEQKLLFFGELQDLKLLDIPFSTLRSNKKPLGEGDAYLITGSECSRIKTAAPAGETAGA